MLVTLPEIPCLKSLEKMFDENLIAMTLSLNYIRYENNNIISNEHEQNIRQKVKRGYPELRNSEYICKRANHSQT